MFRDILPLLCCPCCHAGLTLHATAECNGDILAGKLTCSEGHCFPIRDGVADFQSAEQDFFNQWEALSDGQDFSKVDNAIDASNGPEITRRRELVLDAILNAVQAQGGPLLDIATGRGLLLTELARRLPEDVPLIATDLSAFVLRHDRQKFAALFPHRKISFLACDATCLPLHSGVIQVATTYGGFSNMLGCADAALQEAHRVLLPGGMLADSFVVIRENSQGYATLQQVCQEQALQDAENFFLHAPLLQKHQALFSAVECCAAVEGLGVDNQMDLLPYPGEWYAEEVFVSQK